MVFKKRRGPANGSGHLRDRLVRDMLIIRKKCVSNVGGDCMQRMVDEFLHTGPPLSMRDMRMVPKSDVYETDAALLVFVELPGVEENDVQITYDCEHGLLAVFGRRGNPMDAGPRKRILQKEIVTGPFEKVLRIHAPVTHDEIRAELLNGILKIELPRA